MRNIRHHTKENHAKYYTTPTQNTTLTPLKILHQHHAKYYTTSYK